MDFSVIHTNQLASKTACKKASLILLPVLGGLVGIVAEASAQVIPAGAASTNTVVEVVGDRIDISGGQRSNDNANLFQSFEQFDINAQQTANFVTPADVQNVVGRISSNSASTINGTLQVSGSDANLYLMNPSGLLIGPEAHLNLAGGFTATTATGIGFESGQFSTTVDGDYNKLTGDPASFHFDGQQAGAIVNTGELSVEAGQSLNFIGGTVVNTGELSAPGGSLTVAAVEGENVVRISQGEQLLSLEIEATSFDEHNSLISSNLTSSNLTPSSLTPSSIGEMLTGSGLSSATALITHADGSVRLGNINDTISEVGGSAAVTGTLSTQGEVGGNINVLGNQVTLSDANLNASGSSGGGLIRVGGDFQGNGPVFNAEQTRVSSGSTLWVNANNQGDGGTAIVWADDFTGFSGRVEARGGELAGDGGFTEISGKRRLAFDGIADVNAPNGRAGNVLLDPDNVVITDGTAPTDDALNSYISSSTIEDFSGGTYTISSTDNITLQDLSDDELTLQAGVGLSLIADADGDGTGSINMDGYLTDIIRAEEGSIQLTGTDLRLGTISTWTVGHRAGGNAGGDVRLTSTQGDISVEEIFTYGRHTGPHHSGEGGNVSINAVGDIAITRTIATDSDEGGREAGLAGSIELRTQQGDISVGSAETVGSDVLLAISDALSYTSEGGGSVILSAPNGKIDVLGNIATWTRTYGDRSTSSEIGNGGSVFIQALNDISTGDIATWSSAEETVAGEGGNDGGRGGSVEILSTIGAANLGEIDSHTFASKDENRGGGDVTVRASSIFLESVDASSSADRQAGDGGTITLEAIAAVDITNQLQSYSYAGDGEGTGNGGAVAITANRISLRSIESWSEGISGSGNGGTVELSRFDAALPSLVNLEDIFAYSASSNDNAGEGGDVTIRADDIAINSINAKSEANNNNASNGGDVVLEAVNSANISGFVLTTSETGNDNASNGGLVHVTAATVSVGDIFSQASTSTGGNVGIAGAVSLRGEDSLRAGSILATGNGANGTNADILLIGDSLELAGGAQSVHGQNVQIGPSDISQDINIGVDGGADALNIAAENLAAIHSNNNKLIVGHTGAVGTGTVTIGQSAIDTTGNQPDIEITSGQTLVGPTPTNTVAETIFRLEGPGAGKIEGAGIRFSQVQRLQGGNGRDLFRPGAAFQNSDFQSISGGGGFNTFDYGALTGSVPFTVDLEATTINDIQSLIGPTSESTLLGRNVSNTWRIAGTNSGSINGIAFENFENLTGGDNTDTFEFVNTGNVAGAISGGTGSTDRDSINYSGYGIAIELDLARGSSTGIGNGWTGIEEIVGSRRRDTIRGSNSDDIFQITGNNSGNLNGILSFSNIENIDGNAGNNELNYSNATTPISIDLENNNATGLTSFANIANIVGGSSSSDTITGTAGDDIFQIESGGTNTIGGISFSDIERIDGGLGNNAIQSSDNNNLWTVDSNNDNTINTLSFVNIRDLVGGTGVDVFRVAGSGTSAISIAGGGGRDRLDYDTYLPSIDVNLATQTATGLSGTFTGIEELIGSRNTTDTLRSSNSDDTFQINSSGDGSIVGLIDFSAIEQFDAQSGNNSLEGSPTANNWEINGLNSGSLNGSTFEGFSRLVGGASGDTFSFVGNGAIATALVGNGNNDTLNYSNYNNGVTVDLETGQATGVAGFSGIDNIVGNQNNTNTVIGTAGDDVFTLTGSRTGSINNNDVRFSNINTLNGGAGSNTFNIENLTTPSNITLVGGSNLPNGQSNNRVVSNSTDIIWQLEGINVGNLRQAGNTLVSFSEIQHLENNSTANGESTALFPRANSQITGSIVSGANNLSLIGDDINIGDNAGAGDRQGGSISGTGTLTIRPNSDNVAIELGGVDSGVVNTLNITAGELAALQDGFRKIKIEAGGQGGIRLGGDATFRDSVELRSQSNINTTGGELSTSADRILLEANSRIDAGIINNQSGEVILRAGQDITAAEIRAQGGEGIALTSDTGSISVQNSLATSNDDTASDIIITAQTGVSVGGDINTFNSDRSGNVTITSSSGGISTQGITTATGQEASDESGSVTLTSPGSIEIEFIDATGHSSNTTRPAISIDTRESVAIAQTIRTVGNGIVINGDDSGGIYIIYGEDAEPAPNFSLTQQGLTTDSVSVVAGISSQNLNVRNISVINRGIQPTTPTDSLAFSVTALQFRALDEPIEWAPEEQDDLFTWLETSIGSEFDQYLGLSNNNKTQVATLHQAQSTLQNVEDVTGTTPALIYVYFLPDASTASAVTPGVERVPRPDDQLEVMLIMGEDEPIRHRQWGVTREQVETVGRELRDQATRQFSRPKDYLQPAQQLYDWIMSPIEEALEKNQVGSLGFVLDTGLRTVPLATLHNGDQYLIEDYSIGLLPTFSLTDFVLNGVNRAAFDNSEVLAMGASRFEHQPDLPAVDAELTMITNENWEGDTFLNERFVVDTLQTQLQEKDYGVVHLATHATFESGDLEKSYIQFWDEQLSLSDVDSLHLSEAEVNLIILSACNTAMGDAASEYGFAGFAVSTGAPSAVASLWPVSDEGTLGFMSQFYGQLRGASVRTEALRQAQIRLLNGEVRIDDGTVYGPNDSTIADIETLRESGRWDFSHPFYWSAFTMIGNPW